VITIRTGEGISQYESQERKTKILALSGEVKNMRSSPKGIETVLK